MVRLDNLSDEDFVNLDLSDEDRASLHQSDEDSKYFFQLCEDEVKGVKLPGHDHPMSFLARAVYCSGCTEINDSGGYHCSDCDMYLHKECAESPSEINHPSHTRHPLTLLTRGAPDDSHITSCRLCGGKFRRLIYHCTECEFTLDPACARNPPPLIVYHPKGHEHLLTLMPRLIFFTCNACGMVGDRSPYVCPQCDFMIHKDCIYLPRVININRHHHRVSRTYFLGLRNWVCGVCRLKIDGKYGAYSCLKCPQYAVHSRCATREDVWDGEELEYEPEEEMEDVEPFKVVGKNLINHFTHEEHNLGFKEGGGGGGEESMRCRACVLPIDLDSFYSCVDCDFILHEVCANLPRKKRHVLHNSPLTLQKNIPHHKLYKGVFRCSACKEFSSGFSYIGSGIQLDVRCGSITEPFVHQGHPHPLFFTLPDPKTCRACGIWQNKVLNCIECDFPLCFGCATLPYEVRNQKHDRHPITLCFVEKASTGQHWCDICETRLNPNKYFYTCEDCASTLHVHCVHLEGLLHVKPGDKLSYFGYGFEMVLGNRINRPRCESCYELCVGSFLQSTDYKDMYACSKSCLYEFPQC